MQCSTLGEVCGVCITPPSNDIHVDNNTVLYGFDQYYNIVPSACESNNGVDDVNITIEGLLHSADYRCFYLCYDDYPIWPGYMVYNTDIPIQFIDARTPTVDWDPDDMYASYVILNFMTLILIIF